jgi:two-component system, cell cycle sensor histidine kinase and response regulator CckA
VPSPTPFDDETRFRGAIAASLDAFFLLQSVRGADGAVGDFRLVESNGRGEALLGRTRDALIGRLASEIFPEARAGGFIDRCAAVVKTGQPFVEELRWQRAGGAALWVRHEVVRVEDGIAITSRDTTESRRVEQSLRESEERYRHLVESATDGIYRIDPRGIFTYANPIASRVLGMGDASIVGRSYLDFVRPDYRAEGMELYARQIKHRIPLTYWEFPAVRTDGRHVWVGQNVQIEEQDGRVVELLAVARDITERRGLEEQLRHAQKMEAVGQLAGGVAHDFNNLLTAIRGFSDVLLQSIPPDDPRRADVLEICRATDRGATLTRQLLAFSRRQVMRPEALSLNTVVTDLARILQRLLGHTITVTTRLDPELAIVQVDPGQMEQVLLNLALNARDAMAPDGGRLTIETANIDVEAGADPPHPAGPYAVLRVIDTGSGMTAEVRERLFEPFFTTKEHGRGTGLGLSMVYGIITQSGGFIAVDSAPGQGATIALHLPAAQVADVPVPPAPPRTRVVPRGAGTILIAEDSEGVLLLAERILRGAGYAVLSARDGVEALEVARQHTGDIDLLLTDVMMPRMNGGELARAFAAEHPDAVVAMMSGYVDQDALRRTLDDPEAPILQKPFSPADLLERVGTLLVPARDA